MIELIFLAIYIYALLAVSGAIRLPRAVLRAIVAYHGRVLRRQQ